MVRNIYNLCKPGGRVVGMGSNPKIAPEFLSLNKKYGRTYTIDDNYYKQNGTRYVIRIEDRDANLDIDLVLYWYSPSHYEKIFQKMGFTNFKWVEMELIGDEGNEEYWQDYIEHNTIIMYQAMKPKI